MKYQNNGDSCLRSKTKFDLILDRYEPSSPPTEELHESNKKCSYLLKLCKSCLVSNGQDLSMIHVETSPK